MPSDPEQILRLPAYVPPSIRTPLEYDAAKYEGVPLIIDNGASNLRYGFASSDAPLTSANVVAKYKERKYNKPLLLFGDGIDSESTAKSQAKYPWEGDVLLNFDAMENALDCAFLQLGIDTPTIDHPVLMTERLCSPLHSRTLTSELLFESYNVPSLAYCVDAPMAFFHNQPGSTASEKLSGSGLIISFNSASTSVIPMLRGQCIMKAARRIPWGAIQASDYLLKLIQPKYPTFPTKLTSLQTSWMLQNLCSFAPDYREQMRKLNTPEGIREYEKIIQFPFTVAVLEEKTEEELQRAAEKRREQGKKLQEMAAKMRLEKLMRKETDLQELVQMRAKRDSLSKRDFLRLLESEGFEDEASVDETIKKLENDLKKARKKEADVEETMEDPSFPLVDVPDADLDEDEIKEKKKQKLMKAGWEARQRAKLEKEKEREEKEREERKEEDDRTNDFQGWSSKLKQEQETLMGKIKDRARRKAALNDRKSAAAQARMKNIASLAADDRVPKKKRKGGGEDMFGADDADWAIYRKINTGAASSDEEEDLSRLQAVEQKLLTHDPSFSVDNTFASLSTQKSALVSAFRPPYEEGDSEGLARIHLSTERWRVCEAWFAPGMAGVDSAGLAEVVQGILQGFNEEDKALLAQNVFLTGGPSKLPGLKERVYSSLRPILPPEITLNVRLASDPQLDAWKGMAAFAKEPQFSQIGVTRAEYNELGGEIVKRWWGSNWNSSISR